MCLWDTANENSLHGSNLTWPRLLFCHHLASSSGCYLQTLQGRTFHGNTTTGVTFQQLVELLKIHHKEPWEHQVWIKPNGQFLCKIRFIFYLFCPVIYLFKKKIIKQLLTILSLHSESGYTLLINAVIYFYYLTDSTLCYLFPILLKSLLSRTRVYS